MGADPTEPPSGFSVVRDSIRRDREALFLRTRDAIPTIDASDDDSDGSSDAEMPVFFTEASAADAAPTASLARVDPVPLAAVPRAALDLDDAAALAAFERAAAESMAREEARAAQIVSRHLTARAGSADADAATLHDENIAAAADDDDDDMTTVRAERRSLPRRRPSARAPPAPILPPPAPPTFPDADDDPSRVVLIPADGAPASVSDAVSALYTGWLSGAAGRLASNATGGNRNREPASVSPAGFDFDVAAVEADFAAAGRLDADGNLPPDVASAMPRASVTLDLERSLGGIDLDALLARLSTPEGAATLASLRGERDAVDHDQLRIHLDEDDEDDDDDEDDAELRTTRRHGRDDTETVTEASRGTIASSESAASRESSRFAGRGRGGAGAAPRVSPTGAGAPRGTTMDPYGRGTRRARLASARSAARSAPGAPPANDGGSESADVGFFPSFPRARPSPTVRLNAWETMEPDAAAAAGFDADGDVEEDRRVSTPRDATRATPPVDAPPLAGSKSSPPAPGSPSADAADAAAARARRRLRRLRAPPRCAPRARRTRARRTRSAFEDEPRRRPRAKKKRKPSTRTKLVVSRWSLAPWRLVRRFCWRNSARATRLSPSVSASRATSVFARAISTARRARTPRRWRNVPVIPPRWPIARRRRFVWVPTRTLHTMLQSVCAWSPGIVRRCGGARRRDGASGIIAARSRISRRSPKRCRIIREWRKISRTRDAR